ncbi:hypothetical protein [Methylobacterium sp. J-090]|uniref:hypothetical protein n=1 Tax=Methylobacterium sp. J-090 TaxID=2836666 RepID=UPI001FB9F4D0|nr:hypothetical protein [Methylobacterium sp. J-090]MCJ2081684.1 hypothetical protein [Methylobacterium sp. J-090]
MKSFAVILAAAQILALGTGAAISQSRTWNALKQAPTYRAPQQTIEIPRQTTPRDPTGILRGQGVSSLYGGMGNMGGGSGRSANTGIGLGGIGASQGARN